MNFTRRFICSLLVSILFVQSLAAFADMHHADGEVGNSTHIIVVDADDSAHDSHDTCQCEHCCHGHCASHLVSTPYRVNFVNSDKLSSRYYSVYPPFTPQSLFRPPRA